MRFARFLEFVRLAFSLEPCPPSDKPLEETRRRISHRLVKRMTAGNIRIQRGEYMTREDLDRQYERVKGP